MMQVVDADAGEPLDAAKLGQVKMKIGTSERGCLDTRTLLIFAPLSSPFRMGLFRVIVDIII